MNNILKLKGGNNPLKQQVTLGGNDDYDATKLMTAGKRRHRHSHSKKRHSQRRGGNVLSELAVPAVLLLANQKFGKKSSTKRRFSRRRRSSRYF